MIQDYQTLVLRTDGYNWKDCQWLTETDCSSLYTLVCSYCKSGTKTLTLYELKRLIIKHKHHKVNIIKQR